MKSQDEYTKITLSHHVPVELKDPFEMCIMRVDKSEKLIHSMQTDIKMLLEVNKKVNMKGDNNKNITDIITKVKNSNDEILSRVVKI